MQRLLTAPGRADAPQQTGRHGVPVPLPLGSDGRGPVVPARPPRLPEPKIVRRIAAAVMVGALTMLGVATLDTFAGAQVPVLGAFAALPLPADEKGDAVDAVAPPANPGTCLTWARPDAADAAVVDCTQPHLFEQAGSVALTDQSTLPDDRLWRQLVNERCGPVVDKYLGGKFDPSGRFRIGALKPSAAKWQDGDRELRCGLQSASRSGALYPMAGKASTSDQSNIQPAGKCLAIDGRTVGDPTNCAGQHAVETVGIVDLTQKFPDKFPAVGDQDAYLQPTCSKMADDYAGGPDIVGKKGLTVYWDNITEASWTAGSRKVNCNLAALLPDRSGFAPVTGSVKGAVQVGNTPAPPATNAPAPGMPVTDAPPESAAPAGDAPPASGAPAAPAPTDTAAPPPSGDAQPAATSAPVAPTLLPLPTGQ